MPDPDDKSFQALVLPHLGLIYRVARRLAGSDHEAEDLAQETMLRAYRAFGTFELRDFGVKPWLFKILNNTYLNRRERERVGPRPTDQDVLDENPAAPTGSQATALDVEKLDSEVKRAIDALPEDFRVVLLLWATMELTYQEIADALEVPIGTVMSRLHRARGQLTRSLAGFARSQGLNRFEGSR